MFKKIAAAICAFSFFLSLPVSAAEHGSANEAKAMVQKTIDTMKKSGVQATITEINKRWTIFR